MKLNIAFLTTVFGHGFLVEPPGRSSYHLYSSDKSIDQSLVTRNYQHNELFCGGFATQVTNGYKCGVCGDNYQDERPRNNELGGKFGKTGLVPRTYQQGDLIDLKVKLTAHHKGYFAFKICPILDGQITEDEACFNSETSQVTLKNGETKLDVTKKIESKNYSTTLVLPEDLYCEHCVLQWRYHTGNSWGCDESGCGIGNGEQEEFYGCADIKIQKRTGGRPDFTTQKETTNENPSTTTISTIAETTAKSESTSSSQPIHDLDLFCQEKSTGFYGHPLNCSKYIQCVNGEISIMQCPAELQFNKKTGNCDWPRNTTC